MRNIQKEGVLEAAVENVVNYVYGCGFSGVISSGNSGKLTLSLFRQTWKNMFPDIDLPDLYDLGYDGNIILYGYPEKKYIRDEERRQMIHDFLWENAPVLAARSGEKACYIDDHSNSGYKIEELQRTMPSAGFENLSFAVYSAKQETRFNAGVYVGVRDNPLAKHFSDLGRFLEKK